MEWVETKDEEESSVIRSSLKQVPLAVRKEVKEMEIKMEKAKLN